MKTLDNWLTSKNIKYLQLLFFVNLALVLFVFPANGYVWVEKWKLVLWIPLLISSGLIFMKSWVSRQSVIFYLIFAASILFACLIRGEKPVEINLLFSLLVFVFAFSKDESLLVDKNTKYIIGFMSLTSFVYQLATFRFESARPTLSIIDPNYAGLLMLLFFFFSWKTRFYVGIVFSIALAFVLLSRNYFLALIVFFIAEFLLKKIPGLVKKLDPLGLSFLALFFLWLTGFIYLNYFNNSSEAPANIQRLFHFQDDSNFKRFNINNMFFQGLAENKMHTFFGMGSQYLSLSLKKYEIVLHNTFLEFWAKSGFIPFIFFFVFLKRGFQSLWSLENFAIWVSYFFFASFLHSAFEAKYLIFFLSVLLIDTASGKVNIEPFAGTKN